MKAGRYWFVRGPSLVTGRSSCELLSLPYPFSQVGLMAPADFATAAEERRITVGGGARITPEVLQALHRYRVLVPMYQVRLGAPDLPRSIDVRGSLTAQHVHSTIPAELNRAAAEGRLADPASRRFTPWPTARARTLWPTQQTGYLYSMHQLLGLHHVRAILSAFTARRSSIEAPVIWTLEEDLRPDREALQAVRDWRNLALILTALDTRYWPTLTHLVSYSYEAWVESRATPVADLGRWLGIDGSAARHQAETLLLEAHFRGTLGDFYELVRRANPRAWASLRGEARVALDHRLAAEILDKFADDMDTPERIRQNLSLQRMTDRAESLDSVLHRLELSPHPQLVIGVEGETEELIVPRVMQQLGLTLDPSWIRIVNFGGTDKDLHLLAKYAAQPMIRKEANGDAILERPFTRFLVMTDAENKYTTAEQRRGQRKILLDAIAKTLPPPLRPDLYLPEARTVEIVHWGTGRPFEFAHFTDRQLARAILTLAPKPHPKGEDALIRAIHAQRTLDPSPDIEVVWKASRVRKLQLAEQLWPILSAKIERAITQGSKTGPPVMRAVLRAYELAILGPHGSLVLTQHPTPASRKPKAR